MTTGDPLVSHVPSRLSLPRRERTTALHARVLGALVLGLAAGTVSLSDTEAAAAPPRGALSRQHPAFEPNVGQADGRVRFLVRANDHQFFLGANEFTLVLPGSRSFREESAPASAKAAGAPRVALRMTLVGAEEGPLEGLDALAGSVNYFIGSDPLRWRDGVPRYARVRRRNAYPGIDLIYYYEREAPEFDFVVEPGRDPTAIRIRIDGASAVKIGDQGELIAESAAGRVVQPRPLVFEQRGTRRRTFVGRYVLLGPTEFGFTIPDHDPDASLTIDPVMGFSTFLGGQGSDRVADITVDRDGNTFLVGTTDSMDFPISPGAFQRGAGGFGDAFVVKFDADGRLVYSTYLGGRFADQGESIAVDSSGFAYVVGTTISPDFPTTPGVVQGSSHGIGGDAWVAKLTATGTALIYSSYLGGRDDDSGHGVAVDAEGNAYVCGLTNVDPADYFLDFPTTTGAFQGRFAGGQTDGFVVKLNPTATALLYSTLLGGGGFESVNAIAVDAGGNAYVTGATNSSDFPTTPGAIQGARAGSMDAFVAKVVPDGSALAYSSFLGGSGQDAGKDIAVGLDGSAYVVGEADRQVPTPFPTTPGAFRRVQKGYDGFVSKLNPSGTAFTYSTLLGGVGTDRVVAEALSDSGTVYVAGQTTSADFPTTQGALRTSPFGGSDAFATVLDRDGSALLFSTFVGGSQDDQATGVGRDAEGSLYLAGLTGSPDFPTVSPFQGVLRGYVDGWAAKIVAPLAPSKLVSISIGDAAVQEGDSGATDVLVSVALTAPVPVPVSVAYTTSGGAAGFDYSIATGTLTLPPGDIASSIRVPILGNRVHQPDRTFFVNLSSPQNAVIDDGQAVVTILDDDPEGLSVNDVSVVEPRSGTKAMTFTVTLSPTNPSLPVTVDLDTLDDTAVAGLDYTAAHATLEFAPGELIATATFDVEVSADNVTEGEESFSVRLGNPIGAAIAHPEGKGRILEAGLNTVTPCRLLDTRYPTGPLGGPPLAAGRYRTVPVVGQCGVPSTATAVSLNVTVTNPTADGDLRIYPSDGATPLASAVNYSAGQTRANNGVIPVGSRGSLALINSQATGTADVILDVNGYFQ